MNTLCRYFRHMVERTFPVAVWWELSSTTATKGGSDTMFPSRRRTFPELLSPQQYKQNIRMYITKYFKIAKFTTVLLIYEC